MACDANGLTARALIVGLVVGVAIRLWQAVSELRESTLIDLLQFLAIFITQRIAAI